MTFYIGQNEDPPDESTGTRPDESTTLDPAAFQQGSLPIGSGGVYFASNYFPGVFFVSNYFPEVIVPVGLPSPFLYPPYRAYFTNGKPYARVSLTDGYAIIDAFLVDTPWSGVSSIDLTGASVTFSLRNTLSKTQLFNKSAFIISPQVLPTTGVPGTSINLANTTVLNECVYVMAPDDIASMVPGKYIGTFIVVFPNGSILSFGYLAIYAVPQDSY